MPHPLNKKNTKDDSLMLLPLGGLGQFGANILGLYVEEKLYLIDCGVSFPDERKLGVDAIVPDCLELIERLGGVEAYIITHGHEDHIGALPILFRYFQAPIFATAWTADLISAKFERYGYNQAAPIQIVDYKKENHIGPLKVTWIYITHSLPEASALYIQTPIGNIFHTGDFKLDPEPVVGPLTDFTTIKEVARKGVDIMLCDSTNANKPGTTGTEGSVEKPIAELMKDTSGKMFVTCFSSNVARLQSLINACRRAGRKLCFVGNSLEKTFQRALTYGLLIDWQDIVCQFDEAIYLENHKVCFVLTGSQGEYRGALARLVYGEMKGLSIEEEDTLLFSSRIIPGNERTVLNLMNEIEKVGAKTVTNRSHPDIHVSGHAHSEEIIELTNMIQPKKFIPVHGTFLHLKSNLAVGMKCKTDVLDSFIENGDVVKVGRNLKIEKVMQHEYERLFIDAFSKSVMTNDILRQRLRVGEQGMVIVSGSISRKKSWLRDPEITFIGLADTMYYSTDDISDQILDALYQACQKIDLRKVTEEDLREELRVITRRVMSNVYGRKPVAMSLVQISE